MTIVLGVVTSTVKVSGSQTYQANVKLMSDGDSRRRNLSNVQISSLMAGPGYGIIVPVKKGDYVVVAFLDDNSSTPIIIGRVWGFEMEPGSRDNPAPGFSPSPGVSPSEAMVLLHPSGTKIAIDKNGKVYIEGGTVIVNSNNIKLGGLAATLAVTLSTHTHNSTAPGSPTSTPITGNATKVKAI